MLTTTTVTISRPGADETGDPYETPEAEPTAVAAGRAAHISGPSGSDQRVGGQQEVVDAVLLVPGSLALAAGDLVADDVTGEAYTVTWTRARLGLGLDHVRAGLVAVKGGAA